MRTEQHTLPSFLATYLFYGDSSGITNAEEIEIDQYLHKNNLNWPVEISKESWFQTSNDLNSLGGDVAEYTFIIPE